MQVEPEVGAVVCVGPEGWVFRVIAVDTKQFTVASADGPRSFPRTTCCAALVPKDTARALLQDLMTPPPSGTMPPSLAPERDAPAKVFGPSVLAERVAQLRFRLYDPGWPLPRGPLGLPKAPYEPWEHLAASLGVTPQAVKRAVMRRSLKALRSRGPVTLPDWEYLGDFALHSPTAELADRVYLGNPHRRLAQRVRVQTGTWHAWLRPDHEHPGRYFAMVMVHADHLETLACSGRRLGPVVVDGGTVAFVDAARIDTDALFLGRLRTYGLHWIDANLEGVGCWTHTHFGDGAYAAWAHRVEGRAVMLRVNLSGEPTHNLPPQWS